MDSIRNEFEQAEDAFLSKVEHAQAQMKLCVDDPEPLKNLHDLVQAELKYFQNAEKALQDLVRELDEMYVTQDALYRTAGKR